jgi:Pyruvate/2-oxoacid:ferredoxin oxidoreductase gamma subunit
MEEMAKQVGSPKVANLILLAVIGRYFNILSQKSLRNAVAYKLGKKKELLEMNLAAVQAGWEYEIDL